MGRAAGMAARDRAPPSTETVWRRQRDQTGALPVGSMTSAPPAEPGATVTTQPGAENIPWTDAAAAAAGGLQHQLSCTVELHREELCTTICSKFVVLNAYDQLHDDDDVSPRNTALRFHRLPRRGPSVASADGWPARCFFAASVSIGSQRLWCLCFLSFSGTWGTQRRRCWASAAVSARGGRHGVNDAKREGTEVCWRGGESVLLARLSWLDCIFWRTEGQLTCTSSLTRVRTYVHCGDHRRRGRDGLQFVPTAFSCCLVH